MRLNIDPCVLLSQQKLIVRLAYIEQPAFSLHTDRKVGIEKKINTFNVIASFTNNANRCRRCITQ